VSEHRDDVREIDQVTGTETTGHEWDGIKELNTPMPRWWLWTFYATVAFALAYTILYPAWPGLREASAGVLGWNSRSGLESELEAVQAVRLDRIAGLETATVEEVLADPALRQAAVRAGQAAFKVNCVQCHGSGAAGGPGYPNLNDDDWIWGGTPDAIYTTLQNGIRSHTFPDTRLSEMPAFGRDHLLTRGEIEDVTWHVRALAGLEADPDAAAAGAPLFADNCAACHGEGGEGARDLGAPALNDAIWLYGNAHGDIVTQVMSPRHGVMPGWSERLDDATLKSLAVYVHSLGGGE